MFARRSTHTPAYFLFALGFLGWLTYLAAARPKPVERPIMAARTVELFTQA